MNKIVKEHYPASQLPKELRGSILPGASVKVTIEEEPVGKTANVHELVALAREAQENARGTTIEEAVGRIRKLRDEWDY